MFRGSDFDHIERNALWSNSLPFLPRLAPAIRSPPQADQAGAFCWRHPRYGSHLFAENESDAGPPSS
jgi:hypothetical protein